MSLAGLWVSKWAEGIDLCHVRSDFGQTAPSPSVRCDFRLLVLLVLYLGQADGASVHAVGYQGKQSEHEVTDCGE